MPDNETIVRNAYNLAENKDIAGWTTAFTADGTFTDMSTGVIYRGETLGDLIEIYGVAFSDMHRELHRFYLSTDVAVVQLALQGTHDGPLVLPTGTISPTGNRMDAPCCDVFELVDGRIKRLDCYPSSAVIMAQLSVLGEGTSRRRQTEVLCSDHRDPVTTPHPRDGEDRGLSLTPNAPSPSRAR